MPIEYILLGQFSKISKKGLLASFYLCARLSVRPFVWNNSAPTGWILMKSDTWNFFSKNWKNFKVLLNSEENNCYMTTKIYFLVFSPSVIRRMRNVSDKNCRENQNTYFVFSNFYIFKNHAFYGIMWRDIVEQKRVTGDNKALARCTPYT
jgi:hypothetical protein